ncbi:MAG: lysyl-tRNA synthetase class 2 [Rhodothermales bacterium]
MSAKPDVLALRSQILRAIRGWFYAADFIEVETPVRIPQPALEANIDAEPSGDHWLRTSPELHMKRLVAQGNSRIFQLGPCFRQGERGRRHRPEFTMLEWYCAPGDYELIAEQTSGIIRHVAKAVGPIPGIDLEQFDRTTVHAAFAEFANAEPEADFELPLVEKVEPNLGFARPMLLMDYPIALGAMARAKPSAPHLAERWELYIKGIEIANAYSELTDPAEQAARFAHWGEERLADGRADYAIDPEFMAALESGLPPTGGCALGVDRLVMLFADSASIDDVLAF